jgi:hypothetical protein
MMLHTIKRYPQEKAFFDWLSGLKPDSTNNTSYFDGRLHCVWIPANILDAWNQTQRYSVGDIPLPIQAVQYFITPSRSPRRRVFAALKYPGSPERAVIVAVTPLQLLVQCKGLILSSGQQLPVNICSEIAVFDEQPINEVLSADRNQLLLMQSELVGATKESAAAVLRFHATLSGLSPMRINENDLTLSPQALCAGDHGAPPSAIESFGL